MLREKTRTFPLHSLILINTQTTFMRFQFFTRFIPAPKITPIKFIKRPLSKIRIIKRNLPNTIHIDRSWHLKNLKKDEKNIKKSVKLPHVKKKTGENEFLF